MCVICVSNKGIKQPTKETLKTMFQNNPHGAGYMVARNDGVEIHKGFMDFQEFWANIQGEEFTKDDVVVYHCRISTQGGVNREMCHPFPFTNDIVKLKELDVMSKIGIAHNGIIPMTTNHSDKEYSDTAHFIAEYLPHIIHKISDIRDPEVSEIIEHLIESKMVLMDASGYTTIIGNWITEKDGLIYSNSTYRSGGYKYYTPTKWNTSIYR